MKYALAFIGIIAGTLLTIAMMLSWERPPMASNQIGPRGVGMVEINNPRMEAKLQKANVAPESRSAGRSLRRKSERQRGMEKYSSAWRT